MTEPEQQPAALVENMSCCAARTSTICSTVPPNAGAERCLAHLGWRTAVPRRTSANCAICWKRGAMPAERRGRPPSRS